MYTGESYGTYGGSTSTGDPGASWKAKALHGQLESCDKGPVGPRHDTRVPDRIHGPSNPGRSTTPTTLPPGTDGVDCRGGQLHAAKGCHMCNPVYAELQGSLQLPSQVLKMDQHSC